MSEQVLQWLFMRQDIEGVLSALEAKLPGQNGNATRRNNLSGCRIFLRWAFEHDQSVVLPSATLGSAYLAFLQHKHPDTPASVINRLAHARNFYSALAECGLSLSDPFQELEPPSNDPALHKEAYTDAEIQRLQLHGDVRERVLVLLGAHAGLTGPEVAKLNWQDMQFEYSRLSIRGREVPTGAELHQALQRYAHAQGVTQLFGGQGQVFPELEDNHQVRAVLFRMCMVSNVPYKAWRALRNHAGLRMLMLTHDEAQVARYLGLSTLKAVKFIQRAVDLGMGQA